MRTLTKSCPSCHRPLPFDSNIRAHIAICREQKLINRRVMIASCEGRSTQMTVKEVNKLINQAIKKFGSYNYLDKGPEEVMDMGAIVEQLSAMPVNDVADLLAEVREGEYGEDFVSSVLCSMQEDSKMSKLYEDKRISDLY
jgi:hypothetical protein